jgi:hypothetical protein
LEDAACLAQMADAYAGDLEHAFAAYEERRVLRAARVQLQSRALGEHVYHVAGVQASLRNAIMRNKTADDWYDCLQWLYGGTGFGPEPSSLFPHDDTARERANGPTTVDHVEKSNDQRW